MNARCLTTNPQPQNDRLAECLRARDLQVVQLPLHDVVAPTDQGRALRQAVERLADADWVVVSGQQCVERLRAVVHESGVRVPPGVRVAAVGDMTAKALRTAGILPALVTTGGGAELAKALAAQLPSHPDGDAPHIMSLQAEDGLTDWHAILRDAGAVIELVPTHRLVEVALDGTAWCATYRRSRIDCVLFTSPSGVERFAALFLSGTAPFAKSRFFAIGETTAAALRARTMPVAGLPDQPGFEALAAVVSAACSSAHHMLPRETVRLRAPRSTP